jgi:hypothetical protein
MPLHLSLSWSRRSIRIFSTVVEIAACPMPDTRQNGTSSAAVAAKAVSDQTSWPVLKAVQQAFGKALGRGAIPTILHQDVKDDPVSVHRAL